MKDCHRSIGNQRVSILTSWQNVPGDGISDGGEDPVEFAKGRLTVVLPPWNLVDQVTVQDVLQQRSRAEPAEDGLLGCYCGLYQTWPLRKPWRRMMVRIYPAQKSAHSRAIRQTKFRRGQIQQGGR